MIDVVVIGGSAGALEALLELVAALPAGFPLPILAVLHLSPDVPSLLPGILARATGRAVREIEDKDALAAATIHVAPPNYHVLLERDLRVALSVDAPVNFSRPSIDVAFGSAAAALGDRACGVILSGANEDGAAGLASIAIAGGLALIQSPDTAAFPAMPLAAHDLVHRAPLLPVAELAAALAALGKESAA